MSVREMISPEEARELVLSVVEPLESEEVPLLEAVGRIAAEPVVSDIDVTAFDNSAMDGFAVRAAQLENASEDAPVELDVIAEVAAGDFFEGEIADGQCVRIMTGAAVPAAADSVVKYEIVGVVSGDGREGSRVSFTAPVKLGNNVRKAGEEAQKGQAIIGAGELITTAGVGFMASCGATTVKVHRRPTVGIIATGSELVDPTEYPTQGKIRNSNSYAMAACAQAAGAVPTVLPICKDTLEDLKAAVKDAVQKFDFVITTGGAANGDYDFIKPVVDELGDLMMTTVNMRPGKAQTFGLVDGTPVFGLPGNPSAAYCGFELLIRAALRKMQGYRTFARTSVMAHLTQDVRKKDPRRIYLRAILTKDEQGEYRVTPDRNQGSGSFGVIQRSTCLCIMPEGLESKKEGDLVECVILDISEDIVI
ncbi:MAG: molybdopterin molybdotransferase MoeA [Coriobacteriia bacterium]|nr:molybdopterin molybdotransferase MoeA [Coriobacteriia bacterium]